MKKIFYNVYLTRVHIFQLLFAVCLFCSCTGDKNKLYYYSGDEKVEFTISGDTLGFLLKDTVLNLSGDLTNPAAKIRFLIDSNLNNQNYTSAGYLTHDSVMHNNVKLILNSTKNTSLKSREKTAQQIKINNKHLIAYAGYLIRLKSTNQPLIVTDEIIIEFNKGVSQDDINNILNNYGLEIRRRNPFKKLQITAAVTDSSPATALKISQQLKNNSKIRFAQLNLIHIKKFFSETPNDEFFHLQWHLLNNEPDPLKATEDADIDAEPAWDFTKGSSNIIMAVFDYGIDIHQEDLEKNFAYNRLEIPWNNIDDDANTMVDDSIGWNFISNNSNLYPISECIMAGCYNFHGTAVMGLAAAVQNNEKGVSGICPECNLLPIRTNPIGVLDNDGFAFEYARSRGARIFILCWDYNGQPVPANIKAAISDATSSDLLVFVSMTNSNQMDCASGGLATLPNVFTVSRSNSKDMFDYGGYGDCLNLLAPSRSNRYAGLLKMVTTDVMGDSGNSIIDPSTLQKIDGNCGNFVSLNYTTCFGGSSASTPLVGGTAGLILSLNPWLTAKQVQYLLQDCADKIDTSAGKYSPQNGRSRSGQTGFGRLNAYEAVKIASPDLEKGGRNGVDIFLRDNELDWGNTEKPSTYLFEPIRGFIPCWESMDIKVDALADITPPMELNNDFFERLTNENPAGGKLNKVYVRVRNRGFRTANAIAVKLYWVHAGAGLPLLPLDFWDRFPEDATSPSDWNLIGTQPIFNLEYSGASIANTSEDLAQVASFDFTAPVHDPLTRNHYCLMAIISSPDDIIPTEELKTNPERLIMDYVTSHYNNVTHRNYNIETAEAAFSTQFFMYNPLTESTFSKLEISFKGQKIPVAFQDSLFEKLVYLNKNEKRLVQLSIDPRSLIAPTEIIIQQLIPGKKKDEFKIVGGLNYFILPSSNKSTALKNKK